MSQVLSHDFNLILHRVVLIDCNAVELKECGADHCSQFSGGGTFPAGFRTTKVTPEGLSNLNARRNNSEKSFALRRLAFATFACEPESVRKV